MHVEWSNNQFLYNSWAIDAHVTMPWCSSRLPSLAYQVHTLQAYTSGTTLLSMFDACMCRFDQPGSADVVLRESKQYEGTLQELKAAGAPAHTPAYEDADVAAGIFNAIAPSCLKLFELHDLHL